MATHYQRVSHIPSLLDCCRSNHGTCEILPLLALGMIPEISHMTCAWCAAVGLSVVSHSRASTRKVVVSMASCTVAGRSLPIPADFPFLPARNGRLAREFPQRFLLTAHRVMVSPCSPKAQYFSSRESPGSHRLVLQDCPSVSPSRRKAVTRCKAVCGTLGERSPHRLAVVPQFHRWPRATPCVIGRGRPKTAGGPSPNTRRKVSCEECHLAARETFSAIARKRPKSPIRPIIRPHKLPPVIAIAMMSISR